MKVRRFRQLLLLVGVCLVIAANYAAFNRYLSPDRPMPSAPGEEPSVLVLLWQILAFMIFVAAIADVFRRRQLNR